jgi:hypothetical protein
MHDYCILQFLNCAIFWLFVRLSIGFTGHYFSSIREMQHNTTVGQTTTTKGDLAEELSAMAGLLEHLCA